MAQPIHAIFVKSGIWGTGILLLLLLESCTVTDSVVSRYVADEPARGRHLTHVGATHWSYFWGLLKQEDWGAGCQPGSDMTQVRVTTNPLFISISFLSLGMVIPQQLQWNCAPPPREPGTIGTDD